MYQSKKSIQKKTLPTLKKDLNIFLQNAPHIYSIGLKRKLFLDKLPEAIIERKDVKHRLESLSCAIDIAKHSRIVEKWDNQKETGFAIIGYAKGGEKVTIHIREELNIQKDKKLYIISFFHK